MELPLLQLSLSWLCARVEAQTEPPVLRAETLRARLDGAVGINSTCAGQTEALPPRQRRMARSDCSEI